MSILKKLAGETALYGVSSILGRTLNFLLTPLFASYLAVSEFGVSVDIYSIAAVLNVIYLFGFETTYFRFSKKENAHEPTVFNQIESTLLVSSFVFSMILIIAAQPIATFLEYPSQVNYIYYLAAILFFDTIVAIPFAQLRLAHKSAKFATIKIINIVLNVLLNIFFLAVCKPIYESGAPGVLADIVHLFYTPGDDVKYVFISNLIANAILIPIFLKSFTRMHWRFDKTVFLQMLHYAYPIAILGLAGMVNEMLSRFIFKKVLPPNFYPGYTEQEALGIFGACYKLSMFMSLAIQSFRYAAEPFFFSQAKDKDSPETFALVMKWFIITCLFLFLAISLNVEWLGKIMLRKEAYQLGLGIVPILLMANLFLGIYFNLTIWFKLTDRTIYGTYISIGGAVVTIVFNFLLIPIAGFSGSAATTLLCYVTMAIACYFLGQKYYPIPYKIGNAVFYILLSIALVVISRNLREMSQLLAFSVNAGLLLSFALVVFWNEKKALN